MAITERGRWSNNTVDERGRRVFPNGLDERGRKVFGVSSPPVRTQIATVKIEASYGTIILPVYQTISTDTFRIQTQHGLGGFWLVAITDPNASPLRVQTKTGVMAVRRL